MSYSVTVYFNDANIYSTRIQGVNGFVDVTKKYGSSAYSASGFSDKTTFTATPNDDFEFGQWVYRLIDADGNQGEQQFSKSNPFYAYEKMENADGDTISIQGIIIRAEAKSPWIGWQEEQLDISTFSQSVSIHNYYEDAYGLYPYNCHRYTVVFSYSGYAHFYTESSIDTYGELSDEYDWNSQNSGPLYVIASDDESGDGSNFDIECWVDAGTEYNIYVRGYSGTEEGYVDLYVTPARQCYSASYGTLSADKSENVTLSPCKLYRRTITFAKSGLATFYSTGSVDTCAWLSTESGWNSKNGEPVSALIYDDQSGDGNNFKIKYNVTAGTTYYLFFKDYYEESRNSVTIKVEPPADSWTVQAYSFGTISSEASASFTLGTKQMRRYSVSFENSGSANFFAMGSEDTWGYLSTTTGFDSTNGMPTSYLAEDGTSGPGDNFAITYNVTAGTTYYIWVCESYGESTGTIELYVQPPEKTISITKWSWTASNGNASASQTQAAYSAVVDKTAVTNFSYLVWNDLCDKVKEILDATGGSWDSTYATYANTKMTSSNKTLTATKFNSLRYNIGSHYSTGIADVAPNDDVLGSYFTKLASCINGWIDTL